MLTVPAIITLGSPLAELQSRQIGEKARMLHTMIELGLPVPAGLVLSADTCRNLCEATWPDLEAPLSSLLAQLEEAHPGALFAIRPSPDSHVPGFAEALLNVGINDEVAEQLSTSCGEPRLAFAAYRRFVQDYAHVVMGDDPALFEDIVALYMEERGFVSDTELQGSDARELASRFKAQFESNNGEALPQNAMAQIKAVCLAMLRAWEAPRARAHRKLHGLAGDVGLALIIQVMADGSLHENAGAGRAVTRNIQTGVAQLSGHFLPQGQAIDVSTGLRAPKSLNDGSPGCLAERHPAIFRRLHEGLSALERHLRDGLEAEFVVSRGGLFFLSAKPVKRSAAAGLRMAIDFADQRLLSREEAVLRIDPISLDQLLHATIAPETKRTVIATGLAASPGAVSGRVMFDADEARDLASQGIPVILVRPETLPEDVRGLHAAEGVLTTRGGMTSHAAVIARGMGKPCVAGASQLRIDVAEGTLSGPGVSLRRGDIITIDGSTGQVMKGDVPTEKPELSGDFARLLEWADAYRRMKVRANAETPLDARMAKDFGAEGIGLCRTEHMFFEGNRLVAMREMILADKERERRLALAKVLPMMRSDFIALFEIMAGLPVTIRLLDPPLHEFLPEGGAEIEAVAKSLGADSGLLRKRINDLKEQNPMLGHRGVRLLLSFPEIVEIQVRAIFEAVAEIQRATGTPPIPEIMVPLVFARAELDQVRRVIDETAIAVEREKGITLAYRVGTMIELPRAALRAGDIAAAAEFFSFGTNDLTQTTFGISRDDSARFIGEYQSKGIMKRDPFVSLDIDGVGELVEMAVERGRRTRPDLHLGICGEHGGDPDSIAFCEAHGLDYVSCSPYRVPIARLAAAQASIRNSTNSRR
jgi:pyruvate,orthophosphate dikinase